MATITTYICDHCGDEVRGLFNCRVERKAGKYGPTGMFSPFTMDLCKPCTETMLDCVESFFKDGTPQGYV